MTTDGGVYPADRAFRLSTVEELARTGTSPDVRHASRILMAIAAADALTQTDILLPAPTIWTEPAKSHEIQHRLYPGQGGLNPCFPCRRLFRGKCTLRMGCYVISALLVAGSLIHIISTFGVVPGVTLSSGGDNFTADAKMLFDHAENLRVFTAMTLTDSLCFFMSPGFMLFAGTFMLNCHVLIVYVSFMGAGSMFTVIEAAIFSWLVLSAKVQGLHAESSKHALVGLTWTLLTVGVGIKVYFLMCGFALYLQIKDEEYLVRPVKLNASLASATSSGLGKRNNEEKRGSTIPPSKSTEAAATEYNDSSPVKPRKTSSAPV